MVKNIFILIMGLLFSCSSGAKKELQTTHKLSYTSIEGNTVHLEDYKGKYILIVNVASECGFTKQYKELQELSEKYKDKLVVIGFPCNQFGGQESGSEEEIQNFCTQRFGVDFPLSEKIEVKGAGQHPIYKWLTNKSENGQSSSSVKWNFQKYLISPEGELINYYYSITKPMSSKITKHIK